MFGVATTRQRTRPPSSAESLAEVVLPDQDGNAVRLGELWSGQPAAVVWLRHYG